MTEKKEVEQPNPECFGKGSEQNRNVAGCKCKTIFERLVGK